MIVRDGQPMPISVVRQGTEGEWTIVQSADLRAGDQALGSVTSQVSDEGTNRFGPGGGMMMGPPPGR